MILLLQTGASLIKEKPQEKLNVIDGVLDVDVALVMHQVLPQLSVDGPAAFKIQPQDVQEKMVTDAKTQLTKVAQQRAQQMGVGSEDQAIAGHHAIQKFDKAIHTQMEKESHEFEANPTTYVVKNDPQSSITMKGMTADKIMQFDPQRAKDLQNVLARSEATIKRYQDHGQSAGKEAFPNVGNLRTNMYAKLSDLTVGNAQGMANLKGMQANLGPYFVKTLDQGIDSGAVPPEFRLLGALKSDTQQQVAYQDILTAKEINLRFATDIMSGSKTIGDDLNQAVSQETKEKLNYAYANDPQAIRQQKIQDMNKTIALEAKKRMAYGEVGMADLGQHGEADQLAGLHVRQAGLVELHLDLAGDDRVRGRGAAAIGHVGHLDAGLEAQPLAEQVGDGGQARGAEIDLAGIGFAVGHELDKRARRHRRMDGHDAPRRRHARHGEEVLLRIERDRLQVAGDADHRRRRGQEGVAVRRLVLQVLGADHAGRARLVVEDDRLTEDLGRALDDDARRDVGGPARRIGDDDAQRLAGPVLGGSLSNCRRWGRRRGECGADEEPTIHGLAGHGVLPGPVSCQSIDSS